MTPNHDKSKDILTSDATFHVLNRGAHVGSLNTGEWQCLESAVRRFVRNTGHKLCVVTGQHFTGDITMEKGSHRTMVSVGAILWKAISILDTENSLVFSVRNTYPSTLPTIVSDIETMAITSEHLPKLLPSTGSYIQQKWSEIFPNSIQHRCRIHDDVCNAFQEELSFSVKFMIAGRGRTLQLLDSDQKSISVSCPKGCTFSMIDAIEFPENLKLSKYETTVIRDTISGFKQGSHNILLDDLNAQEKLGYLEQPKTELISERYNPYGHKPYATKKKERISKHVAIDLSHLSKKVVATAAMNCVLAY
jgi:hypothetical protein